MKCSICKAKREKGELFSPPAIAGYICRDYINHDCWKKLLEKINKQKEKAFNIRTRELKKTIRTRKKWEDLIQEQVNWWVLHFRDRNEPCCTCGTVNNIKYDAGHYRTRKSCSELRFEPTNIHKQCSVNCNQYGSGMRAEYREFIERKYGKTHLEWLDGPHPTLKERFPTTADLENELKRWRKINSEARKQLKQESQL